MRRMKQGSICYLCGTPIATKEENSAEHVPPKQFYAKARRKNCNLNLFTLPAHKICNQSYQNDEDYFVASIFPTIEGAHLRPLWADVQERLTGRAKGLANTVFNEFTDTYKGVVLPPSMIAKKFDSKKVWRVVWKIIRGLYFEKYGVILPADTRHWHLSITVGHTSSHKLSESIQHVPSSGDYPEDFDFKYGHFPKVHNANIWGLLFWQGLETITAFTNPPCECAKCLKNVKSKTG